MNTQQEAGSRGWRIPSRSDVYNNSADISLFSTSLPVLQHQKLTFVDSEHGGLFIDDATLGLNKLQLDVEDESSPGDVGVNAIGSLLPGDEDELLAGIMDNFDLSDLRSQLEDMEEYDVFRSGGGMELDFDPQESVNIGVSNVNQSDSPENGSNEQGLPNGVGAIAGEHPLGEHPSRTLFVRNINSNVEESELRALFEQYGDIRTLYTACKHRGFVMISYYDIRAARTAMRALQNKPLRRRKLDIHFSIPKDNPSDKDVNQGTLVVFNLDPSVSNDELRNIFGAYGEVKEIRETPHKRHHKFIEFYDVRAAETALRSLNRRDIAGKRIKLEPSRPGGSRRNLVPQLTQELEQDETRSFQHKVGSPIANSPPGNWVNFSSSLEHNPLQAPSHSPIFGTSITRTNNHSTGLASIDSILPHLMSNPVKKAPISKDPGRFSHVGQLFGNTNLTFEHSYSFPDSTLSVFPVNMSSFGPSASRASGTGMLSGQQFLWGSSPPYSEQSNSSSWSTLSTSHPFASNAQGQSVPYSTRCGSFLGFEDQHHVGSAPSGVSLDRHSSYFPASPETSFINKVTYGGMGLSRNEGNFLMNMGAPTSINGGLAFPGNVSENGSGSFGISPSQMLGPTFLGSSPYSGPGTNSSERLTERWRSRRIENNGNSVDSTKQYQLDLDKIISGEDTRTTLMIKNIPNKYTSKMLLVCIDENNRGTYDFLYLPIDFKNKCNMGYAFINMVAPSHIISFYQAFNGKKWEKFNSEKVASLAYARIQGKAALVTHFQNSSLMNEDKRCRPILFHPEGVESGDQV